MAGRDKALSTDKAHQRYYVVDPDQGKVRVPGVSDVVGVIAKPELIPWANRLGLDGIDYRSYLGKRAEIGTCAHQMAEAHLSGQIPDLSPYSEEVVERAENALYSFYAAIGAADYEMLLIEESLTHELLRFGGTLDIYWSVGGVLRLTDMKTSGAIYPEHWTSVAGYLLLLKHAGYEVNEVSILNIPRRRGQRFGYEIEAADSEFMARHQTRFLSALQLWWANEELELNRGHGV